MNESIPFALGLSEAWEKENLQLIIEQMKKNDTVSTSMIEHAKTVKQREFDIEECVITEYERKLIWSGVEIARIVISQQKPPDASYSRLLELLSELKKL